MSSYTFKSVRETTSTPRGPSTYSNTSYTIPSYSPWYLDGELDSDLLTDSVRDHDPVHVFHLRHTRFGSHRVLRGRDPVRFRNFFTHFTFEKPQEQGRAYLRGIPAIAHQRLSPASQPAYSSPAMPYLLMDEDDIVVLPRRRHYGRVHEELDDDPVLQWYEDRIHHAQAEAIANANKRIVDLCTPRPRHISTAPPYIQGKYKEPLPLQFHKYRAPMTEAMKPIRSNIEIKSRFHQAAGPAEKRYRRIGSVERASAEPSRDL